MAQAPLPAGPVPSPRPRLCALELDLCGSPEALRALTRSTGHLRPLRSLALRSHVVTPLMLAGLAGAIIALQGPPLPCTCAAFHPAALASLLLTLAAAWLGRRSKAAFSLALYLECALPRDDEALSRALRRGTGNARMNHALLGAVSLLLALPPLRVVPPAGAVSLALCGLLAGGALLLLGGSACRHKPVLSAGLGLAALAISATVLVSPYH